MKENETPEDRPARLLKAGGELTGAAAGSLLGFSIAGPEGAAAGGAIATTMSFALKEFAHRVLSNREKVRIGATFQYAEQAFVERLENGDSVRSDDFFEVRNNKRSKADEIIEGVLIASQRQHEEKKIAHLGYLLANISFHEEIDSFLASWLIKTATDLAWSQYVLLSIFASADVEKLPSKNVGATITNWSEHGIHQQIADLGYGKRELIGAAPTKTERMRLSVPNLAISSQRLQNSGRVLHDLMWLDRISNEERDSIVRLVL